MLNAYHLFLIESIAIMSPTIVSSPTFHHIYHMNFDLSVLIFLVFQH